MPNSLENHNDFSKLIQLIKELRGVHGCPWDKEQTHQSLAPYAIEETFEMLEALEKGNDQHFCDELGDVLFQVVLHAQLADERKAFNIQNVIQALSDKIIRRHPHVFSKNDENKNINTEQVIQQWDHIKSLEKKNKPEALFAIPKGLPGLPTAEKIGKKTEKLQFDWSDAKAVLQQLKSEINELEAELNIEQPLPEAIEHELGDVLFTVAQVARHLHLDSESALRKANLRFQERFEFMLAACENNQHQFIQLSAEQKENLWKQAKSKMKVSNS